MAQVGGRRGHDGTLVGTGTTASLPGRCHAATTESRPQNSDNPSAEQNASPESCSDRNATCDCRNVCGRSSLPRGSASGWESVVLKAARTSRSSAQVESGWGNARCAEFETAGSSADGYSTRRGSKDYASRLASRSVVLMAVRSAAPGRTHKVHEGQTLAVRRSVPGPA